MINFCETKFYDKTPWVVIMKLKMNRTRNSSRKWFKRDPSGPAKDILQSITDKCKPGEKNTMTLSTSLCYITEKKYNKLDLFNVL